MFLLLEDEEYYRNFCVNPECFQWILFECASGALCLTTDLRAPVCASMAVVSAHRPWGDHYVVQSQSCESRVTPDAVVVVALASHTLPNHPFAG